MLSKKNKIIIFVTFFIFILNSNSQWVQLQNVMAGSTVRGIGFNGNILFAGAGSPLNGIYKSSDFGSTWLITGLSNTTTISILASGGNLFAGTNNSGIFKTTDNGVNWIASSIGNRQVWSLTKNGSYIFAGTALYGVYRSDNNGLNWTQTDLDNINVYSLAARYDYVVAGTGIYGIYTSSNNGNSWTRTWDVSSVQTMILGGNNEDFYAGYLFGVLKSTNYGTNWFQTNLSNQVINSFAVNGSSLFAGTDINGVFVTHDGGISWNQKNEGFTGNISILSLCVFNNYLYAGRGTNGIWRRPLSELTGIEPVSNEVPADFKLMQNYPNPFNPSTKIRFEIPLSRGVDAEGGRGVFTQIAVYDISGRLIEKIVDEQLSPGIYEAEWQASKYSSGVYVYKLVAGDLVISKKMILIK